MYFALQSNLASRQVSLHVELHRALVEINAIRQQVLRTETFRGYRSLTVGFSGALAFAAAAIQHVFVPRPQEQPAAYLALWVSTAGIAVVVTGCEMLLRALRSQSDLARQHTLLAIEQFLPAMLAGALITAVIARRMPESLWLLPGLWAVLFSLGMLASARLLPRGIFFIGIYYFLCGALLLVVGSESLALTPWVMGMMFGIGQFAMAAILFVCLEWKYERTPPID